MILSAYLLLCYLFVLVTPLRGVIGRYCLSSYLAKPRSLDYRTVFLLIVLHAPMWVPGFALILLTLNWSVARNVVRSVSEWLGCPPPPIAEFHSAPPDFCQPPGASGLPDDPAAGLPVEPERPDEVSRGDPGRPADGVVLPVPPQ